MEKQNVVRKGTTRCDECPAIATHVSKSGKALCNACASTKQAAVSRPQLKNFGETLADQHTAPR